MKRSMFIVLSLMLICACEQIDDDPQKYLDDTPEVSLQDVAVLLSGLPLQTSQMQEVYDAVSSSCDNGYDEEYMMSDLFSSPGAGVGDTPDSKAVGKSYSAPLRDLVREALRQRQTKADALSAEEYESLLRSSSAQIYWPYSENWDGKTLPVITFNPGDGASENAGYRLRSDGSVEEVIVTEQMARESPVWVVNNNEDCTHTTLELMRRNDPEWGLKPGGEIIVGGKTRSGEEAASQSLVLKDFTMLRHYDCWFAGGSEFFVKLGSVESFTASTEAELKQYSPSITDFMIVVKRKELGVPKFFNAVLVSDWTEQLSQCAFMIIEDDGGTVTSWKCSAVVKYNSKSYGFEIEIPYRQSDDIVWRGSLSRKYLSATPGKTGHFGDVDLTFDLIDW